MTSATTATVTNTQNLPNFVTVDITFTFDEKKKTLGTLLSNKEGVSVFTEGVEGKGTFVKLGDTCADTLTKGETYTFTGKAHLVKNEKKGTFIYMFNPIL